MADRDVRFGVTVFVAFVAGAGLYMSLASGRGGAPEPSGEHAPRRAAPYFPASGGAPAASPAPAAAPPAQTAPGLDAPAPVFQSAVHSLYSHPVQEGAPPSDAAAGSAAAGPENAAVPAAHLNGSAAQWQMGSPSAGAGASASLSPVGAPGASAGSRLAAPGGRAPSNRPAETSRAPWSPGAASVPASRAPSRRGAASAGGAVAGPGAPAAPPVNAGSAGLTENAGPTHAGGAAPAGEAAAAGGGGEGGGGGGGGGGDSGGGGAPGLSGGMDAKPKSSAGPPKDGAGGGGGGGGGGASGAGGGVAASGGSSRGGGGGGSGGSGSSDQPDAQVVDIKPVLGAPPTADAKPDGDTFALDKDQPPSIPTYSLKTQTGATVVKFTSKMAIDADGAGGYNKQDRTDNYGRNGQGAKTALVYSNGESLNPGKIPYIVVPVDFGRSHPGVQLGDYAAVTYGGRTVYAIVGDKGPKGVVGEGSISVAKALGIKADPNNGGVRSGVTYHILEGSRDRDVPRTAAEIQTNGQARFAQAKIPPT